MREIIKVEVEREETDLKGRLLETIQEEVEGINLEEAKVIVAINKNREAHIFKEADFGIVGDYREALPGLIEKLKSYL